MANRGSFANRGHNRRRRQAPIRDTGPRNIISDDGLPATSAATDVGETMSCKPLLKTVPVANEDFTCDDKLATVDHSQGNDEHKKKAVSWAEEEDISPIDEKPSSIQAAELLDEEKQLDVDNSSYRRRSGRRTRRSRTKSIFPKPPTCRTIQVSRSKKTIGFYFELARKFLLDNEMIELSGVGMASPIVIHLAELIFESRYAEKDHIHVSMIQETEDRLRPQPKARIQIWMRRSETFVAKESEEEKADCDNRPESSYANGSTDKVRLNEKTKYANGDNVVESHAKEADITFRDIKDQITPSEKAGDAQDGEAEDIDSKVNVISFGEKYEGEKVSSEKSKEGKLEVKKIEGGNIDEDVVNWQTDDGGKSYYGRLIAGQSTHEDGFVPSRDSNEVQTFLARTRNTIETYASGSRSHSAKTPAAAIRGASRVQIPTIAPTVAATAAPDGGRSAENVMEFGNGFHAARLSVLTSDVDTSGRSSTHGTGSGEPSTIGGSTIGVASYPGRATTSTPDTSQTSVIGTVQDLSAAKPATGNNPTHSDRRELLKDSSEKAVADGTNTPAAAKNSNKRAHPRKKDKRSTDRFH